MPKFTVVNDGYFYGKFLKAGAVVELTAPQAKYDVMHGNLVATPDSPVPAQATPKVEVPRQKRRTVSEST